jgi:flagellar basal-body rod modification protein FlgD
MNTIEEIAPTASAAGVAGFTANRLASGQDFFTLLAAQLSAQDPLNPIEDTEFLGQLTQYHALEQSLETNDLLAAMVTQQGALAALQQMTQSAALIGKTVDYTDYASGEERTGVVNAVRVEDGLVVLDVDGESVPLPTLTAIRTEG